MRRLKRDSLLKIDRPFAIFVEQDFHGGDDTQWLAHVVGHQLDNVTCGKGPEDAVAMAFDLVSILTGWCTKQEDGVHDWSAEGFFIETDAEGTRRVYGPKCAHCGEVTRESELEEV
jgi:hypothetical protein